MIISNHHHHPPSYGGLLGLGGTLQLVLLLVLSSLLPPVVCEAARGGVPCTSTKECESLLRPGSQCTLDGYCNNPYQYGCLYSSSKQQQHQRRPKLRICNSDDPMDASERGVCRLPGGGGAAAAGAQEEEEDGGSTTTASASASASFEYKEIRLMAGNWESSFFIVWILQIILSEMLDVPVTLETGVPHVNVNFYDPQMGFDYSGLTYDTIGLTNAAEEPDCTSKVYNDHQHHHQVKNDNNDEYASEYYRSCGHAIMEHWNAASMSYLREDGIIEKPQFNGIIGENGWFMSKYTAQKDSSLFGYFGLMGESNRRKLAERFLRPTTWKDYCDEVDPHHCLSLEEDKIPPSSNNNSSSSSNNNNRYTPGGAATRPPQTPKEEVQFFAGEGLYTGHFRKTDENDCDKNPTTCTGHFLDYPCGWDSYFRAQAYHLNIALKSNGKEPNSGGYKYGEMVEIWRAANYTKSDIIGYWWHPENLFQESQGTDFELQRVTLPHPHHQCIHSLTDTVKHRCGDDDLQKQVGDPIGTCDLPPVPVQKILSSGLYNLVHYGGESNPKNNNGGNSDMIPDSLRSPAYDVINEFVIDAIQLGEIFDYWHTTSTLENGQGFSSRNAVCQWVLENYEEVQGFIPRSYPRELQQIQRNSGDEVILTLAVIAAIATLVVAILTYQMRLRPAFQLAQIEFVYLLLAGMLLVSTASVFIAMSPTNGRCIASMWLVNVGYCCELVPLVVKIAAINHIMKAARRMRRVTVHRKLLLGFVGAITGVVVLYLVLWTVLDPPSKTGEHKLSGNQDEDGRTIVTVAYYCDSKTPIWVFVSVGCQTLMLLCTSILAFLTRTMPSDVNETNILSFLIYSNFVCVLLRTILLLLEDQIDNSATLSRYHSLVLSLDAFFTIGIYFVPKFLDKRRRIRGRTNTVSFEYCAVKGFKFNSIRSAPQLEGSSTDAGVTDSKRGEGHGSTDSSPTSVSFALDPLENHPSKESEVEVKESETTNQGRDCSETDYVDSSNALSL